jgi:hypothetical protein
MAKESFKGLSKVIECNGVKLKGLLADIFDFMMDKRWHTLNEISMATNISIPSASARLRDLRKVKHGSHLVIKRYLTGDYKKIYEYKLINRGHVKY